MNKIIGGIGLSLLLSSAVFAQDKQAPENWFNLDLASDSVLGVSTEKAYETVLKGKTAQPVIVAVIDGGVEVDHEDLKSKMWVNPGEKANNAIDDDKNGYVNDVYGWDFIGGKDGKDVNYDNLELTRLVRKMIPQYEHADTTRLSKEQKAEYRRFESMKAIMEKELAEAQQGYQNYEAFYNVLKAFKQKLGKENPSIEDVKGFEPNIEYEKTVKALVLQNLEQTQSSYNDFMANVQEGVEYFGAKAKYQYNIDFDPRPIVGDNYNDPNQRNYGNNEVEGPDAMHGTHVSGIIAANRANTIGIKGIAVPARIMAVRTVPNGDERDKDVANAIRYAVDNGAKVINMSFGKSYSWNKKVVDDAVKYAMAEDVLLVHAAGNDGKNTDVAHNYPSPVYEDGTRAGAWIEVGATTWMGGEKLIADFSNYGKKSVDLFAPGYDIHSTIPDSKYKNANGTSMASPVVAGVAALVRAYYPQLSAKQVKEVLMKSVTPVDWQVIKPGTNQKVSMSELCISGGVVNAYNALLQAKTAVANMQPVKTEKKESGFAAFFRKLFGGKDK